MILSANACNSNSAFAKGFLPALGVWRLDEEKLPRSIYATTQK